MSEWFHTPLPEPFTDAEVDPQVHLTAEDRARVVNYKWVYHLGSYGFSTPEAKSLLFVRDRVRKGDPQFSEEVCREGD